jgi:hypothetical protein
MSFQKSLVITSIANSDNKVLVEYAAGCKRHNAGMIVVGDLKSPAGFHIDGCDFWNIDRQVKSVFALAGMLPYNSYSRKNIGYLAAMRNGSEIIVETDDDNLPEPEFWDCRCINTKAQTFGNSGWINIYRYFTDADIWPRGFALDCLDESHNIRIVLSAKDVRAPIQQGLSDENPDVDALYLLLSDNGSIRFDKTVFKKGITAAIKAFWDCERNNIDTRLNSVFKPAVFFQKLPPVAVGQGQFCPVNSQNTTWFHEAFPLMYLPSSCNFRMTDIWRGLIAQRIAWTCGWNVLFHYPTVCHKRNAHDLLKDAYQETVGYLHNGSIAKSLMNLELETGVDHIYDNLVRCYEFMVQKGYIERGELKLIKAWVSDCGKLLR